MQDKRASLAGLVIGPYQLGKQLGSGTFATVYKGVHRYSNQAVAIKCIEKAISKQPRKELDLMQIVIHENILKLYDTYENIEHIFLVLELCDMDLFEAINSFPLNDACCREIFDQILAGIQHCHLMGVYHRDLKPENILITTNTLESSIRIADFGLASQDVWSFEHGCGSTRYMAPECISLRFKPGYSSSQSDVWSLGIILLNLLSGKNPWFQATLTDPVYRAYTTDHPNILRESLNLSEELNSLILKVLDPNANTRISVEQFRQAFSKVKQFRGKDELYQEESYCLPQEDQVLFETTVQAPLQDYPNIFYKGLTPNSTLLSYPFSDDQDIAEKNHSDESPCGNFFQFPSSRNNAEFIGCVNNLISLSNTFFEN